uniref:Uncharacterized protein n=1 Tax=Glossina pallidipes TaxID=7398 RepID=A0A1A9ZF15_GLOPL
MLTNQNACKRIDENYLCFHSKLLRTMKRLIEKSIPIVTFNAIRGFLVLFALFCFSVSLCLKGSIEMPVVCFPSKTNWLVWPGLLLRITIVNAYENIEFIFSFDTHATKVNCHLKSGYFDKCL